MFRHRRPDESRDPVGAPKNWIPAFAGMTMQGLVIVSNAKGTNAITLSKKPGSGVGKTVTPACPKASAILGSIITATIP